MTYIPRQKVTKLIPNKFEAIKVAALEARRLNDRARMYNVSLPGKITTLAVDRLIDGKVEYYDLKERARQVRLEREEAEEGQE
jgi:DNA-directed RNA polymerase subunit K/omega